MSESTDPAEIVRSLKSESIQRRLDEIESEQKALRLLWRAARARERGETKKYQRPKAREVEVARD